MNPNTNTNSKRNSNTIKTNKKLNTNKLKTEIVLTKLKKANSIKKKKNKIKLKYWENSETKIVRQLK